MSAVFEYLKKSKLDNSASIDSKISSMTLAQLVEFNNNCVNAMPPNYLNDVPCSTFNFTPSSSLSGVSYCCSSLKCRLQRINKISTFAAMYSDKLIIPSFILYFSEKSLPKTNKGIESMKRKIAHNIHALLEYKPLIDSGILVLTYDRSGFCADCFSKQVKELVGKLYKLLKNRISFELRDEHTLLLKQDKLYTDLYIHVFTRKPDALSGINTYPYIFRSAEVEKYNLFELFFEPIIADILSHRKSIINDRS